MQGAADCMSYVKAILNIPLVGMNTAADGDLLFQNV